MLFKIHCFLVLVLITVTGLYAQDRAGIVNTNIVGTWIGIENDNVRLVFSKDGEYKFFYDNELLDECIYEVSNDDCTGYNSPIKITYLKVTYPNGEEECNQVSVRDDHLTTIEYPTALITEFTRQ